MSEKKSDYRRTGKKSSGQYENIKTGEVISRRAYNNKFYVNQKAGTFNIQNFRYPERLWDKIASLPDDSQVMIRVRGNVQFYEGAPKRWVTIRANIYKDTLMRQGYDKFDTELETNMNDISGLALLWK